MPSPSTGTQAVRLSKSFLTQVDTERSVRGFTQRGMIEYAAIEWFKQNQLTGHSAADTSNTGDET